MGNKKNMKRIIYSSLFVILTIMLSSSTKEIKKDHITTNKGPKTNELQSLSLSQLQKSAAILTETIFSQVAPKEFKLQVKPSEIKKGVEIKAKKAEVKKTEVTIPAQKTIITKKSLQKTKIDFKEAAVKTVKIPIAEAPKIKKAIIDYQPELSGSDNFMRNCQNFSYKSNIFAANCGSEKTKLELNFNKCIANINGKLKFAKNGNYGKSCSDCMINSKYGIYYLECNCKGIVKKLGSNEKNARISLSEKIIITKDAEIDCLPDLVLDTCGNCEKI